MSLWEKHQDKSLVEELQNFTGSRLWSYLWKQAQDHCSRNDPQSCISFHASMVGVFRKTWAAAESGHNSVSLVASASDAAASATFQTSLVGSSAGAVALSDGKAVRDAQLNPSLVEAVRSLQETPQLIFARCTSFGVFCLPETNR